VLAGREPDVMVVLSYLAEGDPTMISLRSVPVAAIVEVHAAESLLSHLIAVFVDAGWTTSTTPEEPSEAVEIVCVVQVAPERINVVT
jgi:hypothetical protein